MSGNISSLERIKKLNDDKENYLLSSKKTQENAESSIGDNESFDSVYKPTTVSFKYESQPGFKRYVHSLKHLLPVRVRTGPGTYMPVDMSGCCAFTFFSWLTPLILRTFRRGLVQSDLYHCSPSDSCHVNGARLSNAWTRAAKKYSMQRLALGPLLTRFLKTRCFVSTILYLLCIVFGFIGPTVFMRLLLLHIQSPSTEDEHEYFGLYLLLGLILCEAGRVLCLSLMWAVNLRTAVRASSAVSALLYKKIGNLKTLPSANTGELVQLFSLDCRKVFALIYNLPLAIGAPLLLLGVVIFTYWMLGSFCVVGIAVFIATYSVQFVIAWVGTIFIRKAAYAGDERVSLMSEFLQNIKLIKLYAWERHLIAGVRNARVTEKNLIEKVQYLHSLCTSISSFTMVLSTIFTILSYTLYGHDITPAEAFTLVMVYSIAGHGIRTLPLVIRSCSHGTIALDRIEEIMHLEEKESYTVVPNRLDVAVNVSNASLDWELNLPSDSLQKKMPEEISDAKGDDSTALVQIETSQPPSLSNVNFTLLRGQLIGVCGPYASGKSSLISAILGQMRLLKGQIAVRGSIAYVPQQPWILNATLRENILFGQLFSSKRYYEAVYACGLPEDIAALPAGDQTELGESGANLSGGQRQRISLARAQYADKELYLLDDPLSSVDNQVGKHIFQHCIKGALKDKSVLLVTHQMQYLKDCDLVVFMRDGTITEQGTHEELMNKESEYASLIMMLSKDDDLREDLIEADRLPPSFDKGSESPTDSRISSPSHSRMNSPNLSSISDIDDHEHCCEGQLTEEEKTGTGTISYGTYMTYIAAAGGFCLCCLVVVWFLFQAISVEFSKFWLGYWLSQGDGNRTFQSTFSNTSLQWNSSSISISDHPDVGFYQMIYALSVVVMIAFSLVLGFLFTKCTLRASNSFHDKLLQKVFRSPMRFFDVTPSGRILNLFTHDVDEIDSHLPIVLHQLLQRYSTLLFSLILIVGVYHWFAIPMVVMGVAFLFLQKLFKASMRDLKRFENTSRSPVLSHVAVTIKGLSTIRAYEKQDDFLDRFTQLVDMHASPQYLYYCSMRWVGVRMDILCLLITLLTALLVLYLKDEVNPAFAALALVLVLQLSGMYQYIVRLGCDTESRFTSVERIQSYVEDLESEAVTEKTRPSAEWPTRGHIIFKDVKMRYRPGLPLVLQGLSFEIEHGEKIGIVGRTGAGKSSLGVALFRLVELSSGSITIDGINVEDLSLEDLRSRMSVIPQDPVLFQGTIRYNLDPVNEFEDATLWNALAEVGIKSKVSSLEGSLDCLVVEGGSNFSVGERQLICMARALLRQSKVVLLDEATASVDNETDNLIQRAVRRVFANSTVLTIAHRLSTVACCDRVMVLHEGKIAEFDQPTLLLANQRSHFSKLMAASRSAS